jgi:hypothetical protein
MQKEILAHKLFILAKSSRAPPVDPKHVTDARLLADPRGRPLRELADDRIAPGTWSCPLREAAAYR